MSKVLLMIGIIGLLFCQMALAQDTLFALAVNYPVGHTPTSVFAADLNADGHNDLAVANDTSNTVSILINNGDGTFQTAVNYPVYYMPYTVFAADFDGDGYKDLAVSSFPGIVSILENNGNGTFQDTVNYSVGAQLTQALYAADLDSDGDNDLAVTCPGIMGPGSVKILLNNGHGVFSVAGSYATSGNSNSVFAADLDNDGDNDLAVANGTSSIVNFFRNNGNGTFQAAVNYATGLGSATVYAADLDNDGDKDIVVPNVFSNSVSVLKNNGDGTFQAAVNYNGSGSGCVGVSAGDFDIDGDLDLAVTNAYSNNVSILRNNGNGAFQIGANFAVGSQPVPVFAADLDGDSICDLAIANEISNNVSILINRTTRVGIDDEPPLFPTEFQLSQSFPNPFNPLTTIQYALSTQSFVTIDIFDILGRKIETFAEGIKPAGEYQVIWDAGKQSSGIYFYRIKAGEKVETKRMMLVK
jgi:hypothetical protein